MKITGADIDIIIDKLQVYQRIADRLTGDPDPYTSSTINDLALLAKSMGREYVITVIGGKPQIISI